jgi:hypothetical protein
LITFLAIHNRYIICRDCLKEEVPYRVTDNKRANTMYRKKIFQKRLDDAIYKIMVGEGGS